MGFPVKKADVHELLRKHGEEETEKLDFDAFRRTVAGALMAAIQCSCCALPQPGMPHLPPWTSIVKPNQCVPAADKLVERSPQDDMRRAFQLFDVHGGCDKSLEAWAGCGSL